MIWQSWVCWWIGVAVANLYQWGIWIDAHREDPKRGYWRQGGGWGHTLRNLLFDLLFCIAWSSHLVDLAAAHGFHWFQPDTPIAGLIHDIPVTPPLGLFLGALVDANGDKIAFFMRRRISKGESSGKEEGNKEAP